MSKVSNRLTIVSSYNIRSGHYHVNKSIYCLNIKGDQKENQKEDNKKEDGQKKIKTKEEKLLIKLKEIKRKIS